MSLTRTVMYSVLLMTTIAGVLVLQDVLSAWEIPKGDIIFSHKQHAGERSIECTICHGTVSTSSSSSDKNLPAMDICLECHDDEKAPGDCELCHRSADEPLALSNPAREVVFSHKDHLGRKMSCEKCHSGVEKAEKMSKQQFPDMWVCMECHDGKKQTAACKACHTESERVMKDYHNEGWTHSHKFEATRQPERCSLCHESDESCEECHLGDNLQQTTHSLNYEFDHPLDARGKEKDCSACHDEAAFCAPCHLENEVMPEDHSLLSWNRGMHADAAKRDIESCISCHETDDVTCLRCHVEHEGELDILDPAPSSRPGGMLR